jgi:hypothetical protein
MSSKLYYWGTNTEVELGDTVEVRRWFTKHRGVVAYIPGISAKRIDVENEDGRDWLIRLERGDYLSMGYDAETPPGKYRKNIRLLSRGPAPHLPDSISLG